MITSETIGYFLLSFQRQRLWKTYILTCFSGHQEEEGNNVSVPTERENIVWTQPLSETTRLYIQHTSMYFTFLHQILTSSHYWKGKGSNSQVICVALSLEMWFIVPISSGKIMRQGSSVMCHTPLNWLVVLVRPFNALRAHLIFFSFCPTFLHQKT